MDLLIYIVSLVGMSVVLGIGSLLVAFLAAYICGKRGVSSVGWTFVGAWLMLLVIAANSIVMLW